LSYPDLSLGEFLNRVSAPTPDPGAGAVAATTVAMAAALTAMSAGLSKRQLPQAEALRIRALELRSRVEPLGERDAEAYAGVLAARARPSDDPERPVALRTALEEASDVPLEIAGVGVDVLDIALVVARDGNAHLRGDALTACLLAQAGIRAAATLVELNLADARDPRRIRAAQLADGASAVALSPTALGDS
jgi:formiminotetrahydrofolate cyclodeaminase